MSSSSELVAEVKRRALLFCVDNPRLSNELTVIETAMLIGASVVMEQQDHRCEPVIASADNQTNESYCQICSSLTKRQSPCLLRLFQKYNPLR